MQKNAYLNTIIRIVNMKIQKEDNKKNLNDMNLLVSI